MRDLRSNEDALLEGVVRNGSGSQVGLIELTIFDGGKRAEGAFGFNKIAFHVDDPSKNNALSSWLAEIGSRIARGLAKDAGSTRWIFSARIDNEARFTGESTFIFHFTEGCVRVDSWNSR